jgi:ribonuclease HI
MYKKIIKVYTDGSFSKNKNIVKSGYGIYFPDEEIENEEAG